MLWEIDSMSKILEFFLLFVCLVIEKWKLRILALLLILQNNTGNILREKGIGTRKSFKNGQKDSKSNRNNVPSCFRKALRLQWQWSLPWNRLWFLPRGLEKIRIELCCQCGSHQPYSDSALEMWLVSMRLM